MSSLLAIDPGNPGWHSSEGASGWAVFDERVLTRAGHGPPTRIPGVTELVIEIPVVRRMGKSKGRPSDLIDLAFVAGMWAGCQPSVETVAKYRPEQWKGQLPKHICHARACAVLSPAELEHVPRLAKTRGQLDMYDAISIGLVHLGRLPFVRGT